MTGSTVFARWWPVMRCSGWTIGRDQTARLMRQDGISTAIRGRNHAPRYPGHTPGEHPDLVIRNLHGTGTEPVVGRPIVPPHLCMFAPCPGCVYTAFVIDAYSPPYRRSGHLIIDDNLRAVTRSAGARAQYRDYWYR